MTTGPVSNHPNSGATDSKSARKKKTKQQAAAEEPRKMSSDIEVTSAGLEEKSNGIESHSESPYIRELQKNIRNLTKKINSMQKVDAIIAENPGQSLEELVASRKINNDQKAQAQKKPALQSQLAQLEEQYGQYKKIDQEYQSKFDVEKQTLLAAHQEEIEKLKETLKAEVESEAQKTFKDRILTLSRFLRAAAARRQQEGENDEQTQAFEGALLLVYGGDASAVECIEKLIDGSDDVVPNTDGTLLSVSYSQIRHAALEEASPTTPPYATEKQWAEEVAKAQLGFGEGEEAQIPGTDPTVAHAGLTELDTSMEKLDLGDSNLVSQTPHTGTIDPQAANAAAREQWDTKGPGSAVDDPLAESYEMIPSNPSEAETGGASVPAPVSSMPNWADEAAAEAPVPVDPLPTNGNDGFREVHHGRGGRGRGGFYGDQRGGGRGRGPRGDGRGRGGYRGDGYRGRGRGGGGGGGGNYRGRGARDFAH